MPIQRQLFNISTGSSPSGDTGPSMNGELMQIRWNPIVADTGADIRVDLLPRQGDTGDGWTLYSQADCLGSNFVKGLRQPQHGSDGAPDPSDTGAAFGVPIVAAGDRVRVKITPGGAACAGRLYLWWKN